jgi:hypothetical protein
MRKPKCECGVCRSCKKREQYRKNRENQIARSTIWAQLHRDRHNKNVADWKKRNPEKVRSYWQKRNAKIKGTALSSEINRRSDLKRHYGVTKEWYETKLQEQNGGCGICGATENTAKNRRMHVDHSHVSGQNRGILCHSCNATLERLETIEGWTAKAQAYLDRYEKEWWDAMNKLYEKNASHM